MEFQKNHVYPFFSYMKTYRTEVPTRTEFSNNGEFSKA